jgi:hypothetical protein
VRQGLAYLSVSKRDRILRALTANQQSTNTGNALVAFITKAMNPQLSEVAEPSGRYEFGAWFGESFHPREEIAKPAGPTTSPIERSASRHERGVGVLILLRQTFRLASGRSAPSFLPQVEARPEHFERPPVVLAPGYHSPNDCRKGVSRHPQPFGPGSVLTGFVHDGLADVQKTRLGSISTPQLLAQQPP